MKDESVKRVGVLGAGTMGLGIATVMATKGLEVLIHDPNAVALESVIERLGAYFDRSVKLGKMTAEARNETLAGVTTSASPDDLADVDVVVEAIFEDTELKADTFAALEKIVRPDVLFHTNTSTLRVTAVAARCVDQGRVIGTHYCNPAPLMKLVEVARGVHTSDETYQRTLKFMDFLGKKVVTTGDVPGFIVNRFLIPFENDCLRALDAGLSTPEDLDTAVTKGLGYPMGPCTLLDIVGLDIHRAVSMSLYDQLRDPRFAPPPIVDRMIAANYLGRKTGQGFYTYSDTNLFGAS
jgi:3-hydroxybutyryl-CoA dehydrogenase